jgi:hypothetical protein
VHDDALPARLSALSEALAVLRFELVADPDGELRLRDRIVADVGGHLARLADWDAPLLVVLGGGTGAGKSTVTNTLAGQVVAATGVVRPTTSNPTLVAHPGDLGWFTGTRVLPALPRAHGQRSGDGAGPGASGDSRVLRVVGVETVPPGLALVDAPDIDSVRTGNRTLADGLLDAADVWVWLATARTYADADGMEYLRRAERRRTALAVVLTQVHDADRAEILADLHTKLAAAGLAAVDVLTIPFAEISAEQLPAAAVAQLRGWLWPLAAPASRDRLRRQTLDGALDALRTEIDPLIDSVEKELATAARLARAAEHAFDALPDRMADALDDGLPLRQEVLDRWGELVGTGRLLTMVESATGMVRTWIRDTVASATGAEEERLQRRVRAAVADTVTELIVEADDLAVAQTVSAWRRFAPGAALLDRQPELTLAAPDLRDRAAATVAVWQEEIVELIRTKGAERKVRARWMTTVLNAAATAAILLAFASTGGLTGAEAGIAAGASAAQQALLSKLLGQQNLNWLLRELRSRLLDRVSTLAEAEARRYRDAVAVIAPDPADLARLREAVAAVDRARR